MLSIRDPPKISLFDVCKDASTQPRRLGELHSYRRRSGSQTLSLLGQSQPERGRIVRRWVGLSRSHSLWNARHASRRSLVYSALRTRAMDESRFHAKPMALLPVNFDGHRGDYTVRGRICRRSLLRSAEPSDYIFLD